MHTNTTQTLDTESLPAQLPIESHHNVNAGLIRLNSPLTQSNRGIKETMQFLIHSLILTTSSTVQAPTSLLLPKSTISVVLAEHHHDRSQGLADCQSQRKRTNNQPNLLTELLSHHPTVLSTLSILSTYLPRLASSPSYLIRAHAPSWMQRRTGIHEAPSSRQFLPCSPCIP
jgi:hypothetical protein